MTQSTPRAAAALAQIWDEAASQTAADTPGTTDTSTDADTNPAPAPAEERGELIDGGEDEITTDFEEQARPAPVAVAVDGDDHPRVTAAVQAAVAVAQKKKVSPMTSSNDMTKADHVRAEIERRQKSGESMRPKDIIETLAKAGVTVTPPQVSVLVKKLVGPVLKAPTADMTPAQKAKAAINRLSRAASAVKKPVPAATPRPPFQAAAKAKAAPKGDDSEYAALFAAANFVGTCGDLVAARKTLDAYERLTATRA